MNACPQHREAIALLAADSLESSARKSVEEHLGTCAGCRAEYEEMQRLCRQVGQTAAAMDTSAAAAPLPAGFHQRLRARVRAEAETREPIGLWNRISAWLHDVMGSPRLALAGGLVAILIGVVLWLGNQPDLSNGLASLPPTNRVSPTLRGTESASSAPTLMAMSRAWNESADALDGLLARQEALLTANDPPSQAFSP